MSPLLLPSPSPTMMPIIPPFPQQTTVSTTTMLPPLQRQDTPAAPPIFLPRTQPSSRAPTPDSLFSMPPPASTRNLDSTEAPPRDYAPTPAGEDESVYSLPNTPLPSTTANNAAQILNPPISSIEFPHPTRTTTTHSSSHASHNRTNRNVTEASLSVSALLATPSRSETPSV
jgi:hypothetical protein